MSDWAERLAELARHVASYTPGDFLMFAPRTYWRLFELHNEAWWPLPLLLPALGLIGAAALAWPWRGAGGATTRRVTAAGLAAGVGFVGWAFVFERYAAVNWAAQGLAWIWAALAAMLLVLALRGAGQVASGPLERRAAAVLALWALLGHPLLAPAAGRPLMQAEAFGLAPDPTALAVLAWLLAGSVTAPAPVRWAWRAAWALVLAHCAASAATLALFDGGRALALLLPPAAASIVARARRSA
ncbi:MAG: hypothetical protein KIT17_03710 [Rubrivivax sp.]|nr:hypothetical protein [Rubrivivax sp.]